MCLASVVLSRLASVNRDVRGIALVDDKLFVLSMGVHSSTEGSGSNSGSNSSPRSRIGSGFGPQSEPAVIEVFSTSSPDPNPIRRFRLSVAEPRDLAANADGSQLYVADEQSNSVMAFSGVDGSRLSQIWNLPCTPDRIMTTSDDVIVATCGNTKYIVCYQDGTIKVLLHIKNMSVNVEESTDMKLFKISIGNRSAISNCCDVTSVG